MSAKPWVTPGLSQPVKWYKRLATPKGRLDAGAFIIEGARHISQVIATAPEAVIEVISSRDDFPRGEFPRHRINEFQMAAISQTRTPQGILAVVRLPRDTGTVKLPKAAGDRVLLLEGVQDPGNVGTLVRTAAALDFQGVILTDRCADPFAPKSVQASAGSLLALWLRRTADYMQLVQELKTRDYRLAAAVLDGETDLSVLKQTGLVLVLGNEAAGLSRGVKELADYRVTIPLERQRAESLNVATSGAILMYLCVAGN
jgi:RNA methyltransferase, TrmH family